MRGSQAEEGSGDTFEVSGATAEYYSQTENENAKMPKWYARASLGGPACKVERGTAR